MKIWIDIKNLHEPLFFKSIVSMFPEKQFILTCRDFSSISLLLRKYNLDHRIIGSRSEGNLLTRIFGFYTRLIRLYFGVSEFDVALSHGSIWSVYVAKAKRKSNIVFSDNDIVPLYGKRIFKNTKYIITPTAFPIEQLLAQGAKSECINQYNGFKEDIYIADFKPDKNFLSEIPFKEFITIRPESFQAMYIPKNTTTIVPDLLKLCDENGIDVLYLPRYKSDRELAEGFSNVFIPSSPLNGLDVCYYSRAVLTGAGTFAREAACIGTTAISFFPGKQLLAVDQKMVEDKWVLHSREPNEIIDYVISSNKRHIDITRSKKVQEEVFEILKEILEDIADVKGAVRFIEG